MMLMIGSLIAQLLKYVRNRNPTLPTDGFAFSWPISFQSTCVYAIIGYRALNLLASFTSPIIFTSKLRCLASHLLYTLKQSLRVVHVIDRHNTAYLTGQTEP